MENFCKHAEGHLTGLNMAEEEEEAEGKGLLVSEFRISTRGSFIVVFRAAANHVERAYFRIDMRVQPEVVKH